MFPELLALVSGCGAVLPEGPLDGLVADTDAHATTWYADGDGFGGAASAPVAFGPRGGNVVEVSDGDAPTVHQPDASIEGATPYATAFGNTMVPLSPATYAMGGGQGDPFETYLDHDVTLTRSFWIGEHEVTQTEWLAWAGAPDPRPSYFEGDHRPVEEVSWAEVAQYANALSEAEGREGCYEPDGWAMLPVYAGDPSACPGYRLPTEAEWELAARAGADHTFAGSDTPGEVAWYSGNSREVTHDVCSLDRNAGGLCDMSGNVKEWTNDWFDETYGGYGDGAPSTDPPGPTSGTHRAWRGGSWYLDASGSRVAQRGYGYPQIRLYCVGFRLVRSSLPG